MFWVVVCGPFVMLGLVFVVAAMPKKEGGEGGS